MDAKKAVGMLVAVVVGGSVIATAPVEALAVIEIGLVASLYLIRQRRASAKPAFRAAEQMGVSRAVPRY